MSSLQMCDILCQQGQEQILSGFHLFEVHLNIIYLIQHLTRDHGTFFNMNLILIINLLEKVVLNHHDHQHLRLLRLQYQLEHQHHQHQPHFNHLYP